MLRLTPDLIAEIERYTSGVLLARREYEMHPQLDSHTKRRAELGCRFGRAARRLERGAA